MAEINVERKRNRKPVWPWIIAIILIVGIIWLLAGTDTEQEYEAVDTDEIESVEETDRQTRQQADNPLAEFISFVQNGEGQVGLSHNYTRDGLQHLADALAYLNNQNQTINGNQYIMQISNSASAIVKNAESEKHADKIRQAFIATANFIQNLPTSDYPEMQNESENLMDAARQIDSEELATNQAREIKSFFGEVADAFEQMKNV